VTPDQFQQAVLGRAKAEALAISPELARALESYYRLLLHWNGRMNLTALSLEPLMDTAIDRLFVEPLLTARVVPETPLRWLDLGSGGGSPAIPLKLVRPAAVLTMVESRGRKAAFLREAVRTLGLVGADVRNCRFEELSDDQRIAGNAELVTVRAVRPDQALFDCARAVLVDGGQLLLFGPQDESCPVPAGFELTQTVALARSSVVVLRRVFHVEQRPVTS